MMQRGSGEYHLIEQSSSPMGKMPMVYALRISSGVNSTSKHEPPAVRPSLFGRRQAAYVRNQVSHLSIAYHALRKAGHGRAADAASDQLRQFGIISKLPGKSVALD